MEQMIIGFPVLLIAFIGGAVAWHYFHTKAAVAAAELKARLDSVEAAVGLKKPAAPAVSPSTPPAT